MNNRYGVRPSPGRSNVANPRDLRFFDFLNLNSLVLVGVHSWLKNEGENRKPKIEIADPGFLDKRSRLSKLQRTLDGVLAQLVEHHNGIVGVKGSNPLGSTILLQIVENFSGLVFEFLPRSTLACVVA